MRRREGRWGTSPGTRSGRCSRSGTRSTPRSPRRSPSDSRAGSRGTAGTCRWPRSSCAGGCSTCCLVRPRRPARAARLQQRADHALEAHRVAQDRLLAEPDRAAALAAVRAVPPAVGRAVPYSQSSIMLFDSSWIDCATFRCRGGSTGRSPAWLFRTHGRRRPPPAGSRASFRRTRTSRAGGSASSRGSVLAGGIAARVGGAAVAVDRRDDQHGRVDRMSSVRGSSANASSRAMIRHASRDDGSLPCTLQLISAAVERRPPARCAAGRVADDEHVDRPAQDRAADLDDPHPVTGCVERGRRRTRSRRGCTAPPGSAPSACAVFPGHGRVAPRRQRRAEHRCRERCVTRRCAHGPATGSDHRG